MAMTLEQLLNLGVKDLAGRKLKERFDADQSINAVAELAKIDGIDTKSPCYHAAVALSPKRTAVEQRMDLEASVNQYKIELVEGVAENLDAVTEQFNNKERLIVYLLESPIDPELYGDASKNWVQYAETREAYKMLKSIDKLDRKTISQFARNRMDAARNEGYSIGLVMAIGQAYESNPELIKEIVQTNTMAYIKNFGDNLNVADAQVRIRGAIRSLPEEQVAAEAYRLGRATTEAYLADRQTEEAKKKKKN